MTYNEAFEKLSAMGSPFNKVFSSSERTLIAYLYGNVLGKTIRNLSCGDCYRDAYIELVTFLKKNVGSIQIRRYRLKEGETLHEFGCPEYYSNPVSDEIAEHFLARFPSLIVKFEEYPSDWNKPKEAPTRQRSKRQKRNK